MTEYAVGDVQGCAVELEQALDSLRFDPKKDTLWIAGDLVNRGPKSLAALRFAMSLGDSVKMVLGNHDLHLLAVSHNTKILRKKDSIQDILNAPDCDEMIEWLRFRSLILYDSDLKTAMSHAGIPHIWRIKEARGYAKELEVCLQSKNWVSFLAEMYGDQPLVWDESLTGNERLRCITNYLTRMRFIAPDGRLNLKCKLGPDEPPEGFAPWYQYPRLGKDRKITQVFGHWAALQGRTNDKAFQAIDTGCVWGQTLTIMNLHSLVRHEFPSQQ